jgi:hypothetical protein
VEKWAAYETKAGDQEAGRDRTRIRGEGANWPDAEGIKAHFGVVDNILISIIKETVS